MNSEIKEVVTAFLSNSGNILILRRSQNVGSYRGRWAGISGYVEKENSPEEQVYIEISEETGLCKDDLSLVIKGNPLEVYDTTMKVTWKVYPFLFDVHDPEKIKIDWEHTEYKWIKPIELRKFDTVPSLYEAMMAVL